MYESASDEAQIGGDFYDAFALPDGRAVLVVGDVSGKGLSAATRTAEVKFALRALLHEDPAPERALQRVNRFLCSQKRDRPSPDEDAEDRFVALTLALIDPQTGQIHLASAGAEPPLVLRGEDGAAHEVSEARGIPLGICAR
jgi:serine phosphatase RsbU (regulator of sigma subunit)